MSGKRILDAIALLRVSRNVAAKHFAIRFSQVELYSKTSSLVKALQGRTTPGFANPSQPFTQAASYAARRLEATAKSDSQRSGSQEDGMEQDHHYERSQENSTTDPVPQDSIEVTQSKGKRRPLPDGTVPPASSPIGQSIGDAESYSRRPTAEPGQHPVDAEHQDDLSPKASDKTSIPNPKTNPLKAKEAKEIQREHEGQIPDTPAKPPSGEAADVEEYRVVQETDVFYQPEGKSEPVLSALPRVKVPKVENDVQAGDPEMTKDLNADVYYAGAEGKQKEREPDEETLSQLFHSPRGSKLLKKTAGGSKTRQFHTYARLGQENRGVKREEIQELATDMAKDVQSGVAPATSQTKPYEMRESRVPSSRVGRLFEYGGLAASMAFGAVSESITKSGGPGGSMMLSPANMERLVAKLSKMRGAALKLGQMISFQDLKMLPKPIHEVLQRVQDSADYMPASQRDKVIESDLGPDWRNKFESFEEKPMAAASIGQVHGAILKDGTPVAVKVQYPGVAQSISSDLNNLSLLLTASKILPKGLYLDKTIANARTELAWECDYIREAKAAKRFRELLADETNIFSVPKIIDEASGKQVLTMERMKGIAVTKLQDLTQEQRDWIGSQILRLCLREIMEFRFMQTDPNWTNFLFNKHTDKIELLDFGASRDYPANFIDLYVRVLEAASRKDRKAVGDISVDLGYLTGYESKAMLNAHIDSVLTLAEPFTEDAPDLYDFQDQTITDRVRSLIPVMVRERLAPPPEETYSLHRKLSGAFLLCARLGSRVKYKELFRTEFGKFKPSVTAA